MNEDHRRFRQEQRETTDRFIAAITDGLERLESLCEEVNRTRELDGQIRDSLPAGELGDTLRDWLDSHDRVADELQASCEAVLEVLKEGAGQAAATELYLHELDPHAEDPRG